MTAAELLARKQGDMLATLRNFIDKTDDRKILEKIHREILNLADACAAKSAELTGGEANDDG